MAKRLGEILVDDGKLTEEQLQKALKAQLIFGGHLGTSLIELGYIDEETLGAALSAAFGVPVATYEVLESAPYAVIRAIPAKLVEKYKVVPIRLDGKTLHLAMLDPKNLMALDEISFVTGYRIESWVSPEIRIFQILEKYYNIPRSQRYITLAKELGKLQSPSEKIQPSGRAGEDSSTGIADEEGHTGDTAPMPAVSRAAAAGARAGGTHPPDHWEKYGYGRSWREYADAIERQDVSVAAPAPAAPAVRRESGTREGGGKEENFLAEATRRLQGCSSVEEVADVVLSVAARRLPHTAFFIVRGEQVVGWGGSGDGLQTSRVKGMNLPTEKDSFLSLVADGRSHFMGRPPAFPSIRQFYQELNLEMPRSIILVPIRIKDRGAAFLYGDGGEDELRSVDVDTLERLAHKASLALQMIILRNKIATA